MLKRKDAYSKGVKPGATEVRDLSRHVGRVVSTSHGDKVANFSTSHGDKVANFSTSHGEKVANFLTLDIDKWAPKYQSKDYYQCEKIIHNNEGFFYRDDKEKIRLAYKNKQIRDKEAHLDNSGPIKGPTERNFEKWKEFLKNETAYGNIKVIPVHQLQEVQKAQSKNKDYQLADEDRFQNIPQLTAINILEKKKTKPVGALIFDSKSNRYLLLKYDEKKDYMQNSYGNKLPLKSILERDIGDIPIAILTDEEVQAAHGRKRQSRKAGRKGSKRAGQKGRKASSKPRRAKKARASKHRRRA